MQSYQLTKASLKICADQLDLAKNLAEHIVELSTATIEQTGNFTLALSGGSTPRVLYDLLAHPPFSKQLNWQQIHLFWSDERCVSNESSQSNYKMVAEVLLSKIAIPKSNIHRLYGQDTDPKQAAGNYQDAINKFFQITHPALPQFDLVLLGLGLDGHTASLFPKTSALLDTEHLVAANYVPQLSAYRITFTLLTINSARHVIFMVAGQNKRQILSAVLADNDQTYPAKLVSPTKGSLEWYVDSAAASQIRME